MRRAAFVLSAFLYACRDQPVAPALSGTVDVTAALPVSPYTVNYNISYGTAAEQKFDLYRPVGATGVLPVIVYFHGAGADKAVVRQVGAICAIDSGWSVVSANYRD